MADEAVENETVSGGGEAAADGTVADNGTAEHDAAAPAGGATSAAAAQDRTEYDEDVDDDEDGGAAQDRPAGNTAAGNAEESGVTFKDLGLSGEVLAALEALGYEEPTPIQTQAIPILLEGRDVIGRAATGTGKTAAFALPLVERIRPDRSGVKALILAPTRELAVQVAEAVHKYGARRRVSVLAVYGGQPIERQLQPLRRGVDVVVGTPGRILDHIRRRSLDLSNVDYVVLDEADEMLDMGFIEDIEAILTETPAARQTALFSATFPPRIADLAKRHMRDPERITVKAAPMETPLVRQVAYTVPRPYKLEALGRILDLEAPTSAIIFCRTRNEVDELNEALTVRGYRPEALHGGLNQTQRDRVMRRFRDGTADLLIATDVAARGLDVEHVSHVFNYDIPQTPEAYVHRIGRTGRAGREGTAISIVQPRERQLMRAIERLVGRPIEHARVPTAADLRSRRLELLRSAIRETLEENDFEMYREAISPLAEQFDVLDVAAAAAKLAADASRGEEPEAETEIPEWEPRRDDRGDRGPNPRRTGRTDGPARGGGRRSNANMTRLFISVGARRGIRPGDIVGAIAGEARIPGDSIGAIEIADQFS
ncbi:MAG TPA: DEAD/DEAH box helicase, partial [Longimicrobiaceae bacterium]|nr:DEAD/DEAH box helicase [Longimicrobiaceae bacterium]